MLNITEIRNNSSNILAIGSYRPGYQAILDFDFMCNKQTPSIIGIISSGKRFEKYFWGNKEVLIPCFPTIEAAKAEIASVDWMLNISSGRRALASTVEFFTHFPDAKGGHIFAEGVPEKSALELYEKYQLNGKKIIGPAGVGLIVPGALKLGVIGGVDWRQIQENSLAEQGNIAVMSASGGMVNEIITTVCQSEHRLSFGICFGGDRFPSIRPRDAFLAAEHDEQTTHIVYYGELGGQDEYEIAELIKSQKVKKPVIAYIAGIIGEVFDQPVQFGHAKALANTKSETASEKRNALREAGATVATSMTEFNELIAQLPKSVSTSKNHDLSHRSPSMFTSTISSESSEGYMFAGTLLQDWASERNIALQITTALLGKRPSSPITSEFIEHVFLLSIDHGPQVSGSVNTIVTARAGKGSVDSLAAGLLTVGPRFGGAVSEAAREWFDGVSENREPKATVELYAASKKIIAGIGHKKYRLDLPDPRTKTLAYFADRLEKHPHFDYAKSIEAITTTKKGTLILNVDGHIAALMLDILTQVENYTHSEIDNLINADFFNALFVIPRSVGFIAHYLDQKRLDEGLFRLPDDGILLA